MQKRAHTFASVGKRFEKMQKAKQGDSIMYEPREGDEGICSECGHYCEVVSFAESDPGPDEMVGGMVPGWLRMLGSDCCYAPVDRVPDEDDFRLAGVR